MSEKKISEGVREAIKQGAVAVAKEEGMIGIQVDKVFAKAEDILSKPKYSKLVEKVFRRLPYRPQLSIPAGEVQISIDDLAKALEGIREVPEIDGTIDYEGSMRSALAAIFRDCRNGKYDNE